MIYDYYFYATVCFEPQFSSVAIKRNGLSHMVNGIFPIFVFANHKNATVVITI